MFYAKGEKMEWIDDNHVKGEMTDEDFARKVEKEAKIRDIRKHGRDGIFKVYEERYTYKGVPYFIKILRYYQLGVPLNEIRGMNNLGKWAVLEHPSELKEFATFLSQIEQLTGLYEFLYADTLHSGQENWTLKQMVKEMHRQAKEDIDQLPDLEKTLQQKFLEITQQLKKLLPK